MRIMTKSDIQKALLEVASEPRDELYLDKTLDGTGVTKEILEKLLRRFSNVEFKINLKQRYGLINHLRWLLFKKPGNFNNSIPIVDSIYKLILTRLFGVSDTLVIVGQKK